MSAPGISPTAAAKLRTLRRDLLTMDASDLLAHIQAIRDRRRKPPKKGKIDLSDADD